MKTVFAIVLFAFCFGASAQDSLEIRKIDALVSQINASALPIQRDTIVQDHSAVGLKMTTYLSMIVDGKELIKYVNHVNATKVKNGIAQNMTSSNSFYYHHNNLIKVEEYLLEGEKKMTADWYYLNDKPLFYTLQSDKAKDRAALLLTMSKAMLKQIIK